MKLLSRPLNYQIFEVNLVYPLRKITSLLYSFLLFKYNSTLFFDLLTTHPFLTYLLKGDGEGTVQVLNVSKICFTCHLSLKQANKKYYQLTESFF